MRTFLYGSAALVVLCALIAQVNVVRWSEAGSSDQRDALASATSALALLLLVVERLVALPPFWDALRVTIALALLTGAVVLKVRARPR